MAASLKPSNKRAAPPLYHTTKKQTSRRTVRPQLLGASLSCSAGLPHNSSWKLTRSTRAAQVHKRPCNPRGKKDTLQHRGEHMNMHTPDDTTARNRLPSQFLLRVRCLCLMGQTQQQSAGLAGAHPPNAVTRQQGSGDVECPCDAFHTQHGLTATLCQHHSLKQTCAGLICEPLHCWACGDALCPHGANASSSTAHARKTPPALCLPRAGTPALSLQHALHYAPATACKSTSPRATTRSAAQHTAPAAV